MSFLKLSTGILGVALFAASCNLNQTDERAGTLPYPGDATEAGISTDPADYYAKDNLDLQAVGALLERAESPEEFEYLLNSEEGINNLDLNGDNLADYISVREFGDENGGERGLSLFSMFGPELIQEIATIFFDRDGGEDFPGARILLSGNEQIYGDDNYYETNWLEKSLAIVDYLFTDRDDYYSSPYYNENYPDYYEPYQIVETPVYRTRIEQYYPQPVFIQTSAPAITQIEIVSPYRGRTVEKVYPKLVKPTKEQANFKRNNPAPPAFVPVKNGKAKEKAPKFNEKLKAKSNDFERPGRGNNDKRAARGNPNKAWKQEAKAARTERPNVRQGPPARVERPNIRPAPQPVRMERPNRQGPPARAERPNMKPPKQDNPGRGNGGGNNPGKGNGGGGGGKGNGGGKGGGKKG
jgi:hypothetical protein